MLKKTEIQAAIITGIIALVVALIAASSQIINLLIQIGHENQQLTETADAHNTQIALVLTITLTATPVPTDTTTPTITAVPATTIQPPALTSTVTATPTVMMIVDGTALLIDPILYLLPNSNQLDPISGAENNCKHSHDDKWRLPRQSELASLLKTQPIDGEVGSEELFDWGIAHILKSSPLMLVIDSAKPSVTNYVFRCVRPVS
jgi:hypothetical protein